MDKIKGGYYLKAKCIQDSSISSFPPHTREIWDWILNKANYQDNPKNNIKRGQLLCNYKDMQEGLKWMVGWRTCKYSKHHCEISMKLLKKATMVTTTKTTRGILITVLNYDKYQNVENYESYKETYKKATRKPQTPDTIQKKDKEIKEKEYNKKKKYHEFVFLTEEEHQKLNVVFGGELEDKIETLNNYIGSTGKKYQSHYHTLISWDNKDKKNTPKKLTLPSV